MKIFKRIFIGIFVIGIMLSLYQFYADSCVWKSQRGTWKERYMAVRGVKTLDAKYGQMICGHNYAVISRDYDKMEESYQLACRLYKICPNYRDISKMHKLYSQYYK